MKNARKSDPCTSHESAQRVKKLQIVQARDLVRKFCGCTYQQLYRKHLVDSNRRHRAPAFASAEALGKRLSDAERRGLIIPSSRMTCPVTGRSARTWHAR